MPELPDIEVFTRNLNKLFNGQTVREVKVLNGNKFPNPANAYSKSLKGKTIKKIYRSGKEMRFSFSDGTLLGVHLMLTGDIMLFDKKNLHHSTLAEMHFSSGKGIALCDRMKNARMTLNPVDKAGIDALSKKLDYKFLLEAFKGRKKEIKSLLTDQDFIRGIGNSYSDEILWKAGISPWSIASAIPPEKVKKLSVAIQEILSEEVKNIFKRSKGKVNGEVKDFLKIHTKLHTKSPTGAPIIIVKKGMMKTYYTKEQVLYI